MNDLVDLLLSFREPSMIYTVINLALLLLSFVGIVVLIKSFVEYRNDKKECE